MSSVSITGETRASVAAQSATGQRIVAIDALRGIALLLMALDHSAFFVGASMQAESYGGQPVVLQSAAYWLSGLLTNLASPIFFFLGGYSLALYAAAQARRGQPQYTTTRFMVIRALVILLLDVTVCAWFWRGATPYVHVLTSIAAAMLILAGLRHLLSPGQIGVLAIGTLLLHQAIIGSIATELANNAPQSFWQAFWLTYSYDTRPAIGFAVLGWGPLLWLGYALGHWQDHPALRQPQRWAQIGIGLLALWCGLRLIGGFGDLGSFATIGGTPVHLFVMSKAPPSLSYFAFNLGLAAFLLALAYARPTLLTTGWLRWLPLVGQVSLFFYVAHIVLYHLIALLLSLLPMSGPRIIWGYSAWLIGLAALIPLGYWYRQQRKRYPRLLSYL
ncbi:DUF1624 domain-containing protein [Chloroflexus sp.]|uniref:DUF1624 domain-containing protein n=1 Tax=Chloroflexus sp. TaxID=1904827 RepID=UPI00262D4CC0|nr:heparan-alpha-glucosaminide N-acetyltransferase domain-containing protein [uncultured Chloroflexus sp.]